MYMHMQVVHVHIHMQVSDEGYRTRKLQSCVEDRPLVVQVHMCTWAC